MPGMRTSLRMMSNFSRPRSSSATAAVGALSTSKRCWVRKAESASAMCGSSSTIRMRPGGAVSAPSARRNGGALSGLNSRPGSAGGSSSRKVVPLAELSTSWIAPSCAAMMVWQIERPRPVPSPGALVVKNGSKMRSRALGGTPAPLSLTRTRTTCGVRSKVMRMSPLVRPLGIACSALVMRLCSTCVICCAQTYTGQASSGRLTCSFTLLWRSW